MSPALERSRSDGPRLGAASNASPADPGASAEDPAIARRLPASAVQRQGRAPLAGRLARHAADEIAATEGRRLVCVCGVRGSGKTALLNDVAARLGDAGIEVLRDVRACEAAMAVAARAADAPNDVALVVDDAHLLPDDEIGRIHALVRDPAGPHVVVAQRTWHASRALGALVASLDAVAPCVLLGSLEPDEVADWVRRDAGLELSAEAAARLVRATAGAPWLVRATIEELEHHGPALLEATALPDGILERLAIALSQLEPDVYELALALSLGFDLATLVLPTQERFEPARLDELVARSRAAGVLTVGGGVVPVIAHGLVRTAPANHVAGLRLELLAARMRAGRPIDDVVDRLTRAGLADERLVDALERRGDELLQRDPAAALAEYDRAAAAGAPEERLRVRRATACVGLGDHAEAARLIERHFARGVPADAAAAVDVAAAAWSALGMLDRAAAAYGWLDPRALGSSSPLAAVALYGTGRTADAERMLAHRAEGFPTAAAVAARLMGEGVQDSLRGAGAGAYAKLARSALALGGSCASMPAADDPVAVAALVAMHSGDVRAAETALDTAIAERGAAQADAARLRLLRAWAAMLRDDVDRARAETAAAVAVAVATGRPLAPREELLRHGLEVGLARRADDIRGLVAAWERARESIMRVSPDLFGLLPVGELAIAAARVRDTAVVEPVLEAALELVRRLGEPPVWSTLLHWAGVQAGILANRPADLAPHAAALVRSAEELPLAAALAAAGRSWVAVLGGRVDAGAVEASARGLAQAGLPWDGARLAGHAAARADRQDMIRLLQCARELRAEPGAGAPTAERPRAASGPAAPAPSPDARADDGRGAEPEPSAAERDPAERGADGAAAGDRAAAPAVVPARTGFGAGLVPAYGDRLELSERELEVARLVVAGRTYVEIGRAIFISPRTVEHHVARIRRRLGAASRSELLERLRLAVDGGAPPGTP